MRRVRMVSAESLATAPAWHDRRFVVFDNESTGLDPRKDRIVSIGAVAVRNDEILLDDTFEATVRIAYNTSAVVVHGITQEESRRGVEEADAVRGFLTYLGNDILVGHHVMFDYLLIEGAARRLGHAALPNQALDTMRLALALEAAGAFAEAPITSFDFDSLCARFGVVPHDRHTAPGDAFLTAQIFLKLLRLLRRHGLALASLFESRDEA
jgi:DNA polymerase-3 subunit epsilon